MTTSNSEATTDTTQGLPIKGAVALVTGANRGLGRHFARQLIERGATKVYATARRPETIDLPGVVPLRLDVTDGQTIRAAAVRRAAVHLRRLVSKAAQWAMTNAVRLELADQRTLVTGLHLGAVDTDLSAGYDGPKGDPADAVRAGLDGIAAGALEVIADDWSAHVKKSLAEDPAQLYAEIRAGVV